MKSNPKTLALRVPLPPYEGAPAARVDNLVIRQQRRGAGPHFEVQVLGRRRVGRCGERVPVAHMPVTADFDVSDVAELVGLDEVIARFDEVRGAAALRADL